MQKSVQPQWRKCSTCKKEIALNTRYYECNVSTCTGQRTGYVFCSVSCWEVHLPGAKHRNAGAVEKTSPASLTASTQTPVPPSAQQGVMAVPRRIIVANAQTHAQASMQNNPATKKSSMSNEVLVVVSKMKQYIREISEMNTSEDVSFIISEMIRLECDKAVSNARADGRKTVMARDFK